MKRIIRTLALLCLTALLLGTTALADFGPKPSLTVHVINMHGDPYYLDLLAPGEPKKWEPPTGEQSPLFAALLENIPEGWHACVTQGNGAPIYGGLSPNDDGVHYFSYVGVPDTYRILIVTNSGEVWISDTLQRKVLQSSVTVNWETKETLTPAIWLAYAAQFAFTLLPTLLIELLVLLLFRFELKSNIKNFLWVNLLTQGLMSLFSAGQALTNGVSMLYILWFVPLELVIAFAEAGLYSKLLRGHTRRRAFAYGLTANAVSAIAGWYLMNPLWRWVMSLC